MKKLLLLLSIVFASISSFGQNTSSLPYWPLLIKQDTLTGTDSLLLYSHTTNKYQKISFTDFNSVLTVVSDTTYIRIDGTSPETTGNIKIGHNKGFSTKSFFVDP